jgi:hypothetical protein
MKHKDHLGVVMPGANPEYARAQAERRRSSAAGKHADRRTRRNRSRQAQRGRAIRDAS